MAQSKALVEEAFPGDVVGLYDIGIFNIGDTLTQGETFMFTGIPRFSPEIFKILHNASPFKSKQLEKGIQYLTDEGLAQLFIRNLGNKKVVGVVGDLQFDVLKHRLLNEFGASVEFLPMAAFKAFWLKYDSPKDIEPLKTLYSNNLYVDKNNHLVFIADSAFSYEMAREKCPHVRFVTSIEHNDQTLILENAV